MTFQLRIAARFRNFISSLIGRQRLCIPVSAVVDDGFEAVGWAKLLIYSDGLLQRRQSFGIFPPLIVCETEAVERGRTVRARRRDGFQILLSLFGFVHSPVCVD